MSTYTHAPFTWWGKLEEKHNRLFEMTHLTQKRTGLPMIIWVSPALRSHGARIKVQTDYSHKVTEDTFSVSISSSPEIKAGNTGKIKSKELSKVFQFVIDNEEGLMKIWNQEIDHIEFVLDYMKPYRN